jgi:hypothetical protein
MGSGRNKKRLVRRMGKGAYCKNMRREQLRRGNEIRKDELETTPKRECREGKRDVGDGRE